MTQHSSHSANSSSFASQPRPQRTKGRAQRSDPQVKRVTCPWINGQIIAAADTQDLGHLVVTITAHLDKMNMVKDKGCGILGKYMIPNTYNK